MVAVGNELSKSKFAQGVALGPNACSSRIAGNKIFDNTSFGIKVTDGSKDIVIEHNEIYQNGEFGIMLSGKACMAASKNTIFENWHWGINISHGCCATVSENIIHNNVCGGIRVAPTIAKVVLVQNEVRDHDGPGILAGEDAGGYLKLLGIEAPQTPPLKICNIEMRNVEKQQHPKERLSSLGSRCAFCHAIAGAENVLQRCRRCSKAFYCGKQCQKQHWKKHKPLCLAIEEKFSEVVMVPAPKPGIITTRRFHPDLEGLKQAPKPDRNCARRFIVKIETKEDVAYNPGSDLTLYDQSTDVDFYFHSPNIYHIIIQCGVLGKNGVTAKKIFCYASFEENGKKLRIYLDELAPFQKW